MSIGAGFEEFVAIVDAGSLTAAARELGLPRPTLSRRLARLEERLGVRLMHRSTRRLQLTEQGEALYPTARRVVDAARDVEARVRRLDDVPRGRLRISIPTGVPSDVFAGWMGDFLALYPEVQVEVVASSLHVDLVGEGFDLALRAGPIEDPTLIAVPVNHTDLLAVASPAYLAEHGTPRTLADLEAHNCVVGFGPRGVPETKWPLWEGGSVEVHGTLRCNQMHLRHSAARLGLGIALVSDHLTAEDVDRGRLRVVLGDQIGRRDAASLVYPDRSYLEPRVRAFVDFLRARMSEIRRQRREARG